MECLALHGMAYLALLIESLGWSVRWGDSGTSLGGFIQGLSFLHELDVRGYSYWCANDESAPMTLAHKDSSDRVWHAVFWRPF